MPASIRTTLHTSPGGPVTGAVLVDTSREDLRKGYQVVLESVNVATTYAWAISFKPEAPDRTDSTAALLPPENANSQTAKFNVDFEGAYLIRLTIDAGLPTESSTYIRCRFLTRFGNLKLVAAGERRDQNGVIPVDATAEGWSNDQNQNQQLILAQLRRQATTGRMLWVDANRGRDSSNTIGDPANTYDLPGADSAATEDELSFTAEAHGDFQTINEAITYANDAVARGEPAPSATDPYIIRIKPGLYTEDLVLQPYIHLVGEDWSRDAVLADGVLSVICRTANAGGNTHTYNPTGDTDPVFLACIQFENQDVTVEPVIKHSRGLLVLDHCSVQQFANGAAQGACIETITAGGGEGASLYLSDTLLISSANVDDDRWVVIIDSEATLGGHFIRSELRGRSCISFNQSCYIDAALSLQKSVIDAGAGYGIRSGGHVGGAYTDVQATDKTKCFLVDGFLAGAGANPGDVIVDWSFGRLQQLIFDKTFVAGNTTFSGASIETVDSPDEWLQAPGGALTTTEAKTSARSIEWHEDWRLPENQPAGALTVPAASKFPDRNVQDILDLLANIVNPQGAVIGGAWPGTGGLTLNAAYDGVNSYSPFVAGAGLGRFILADNGAVQILGAVSPGGGIVDPDLNGGLVVEGAVDIGPTVGDGLGSEIFLEPNPFGFGPRASFGRAVWHNELTAAIPGGTKRPAPAGFIRGGLHSANGGYSLWMVSRSTQDDATGEQGRLIISAGRTNEGGTGNTNGAGLFLAAGDVLEAAGAGLGGHIWMTPGHTANAGDSGRLRVVCTDTATPMVITASVTYVTNGPLTNDGTLHLGTPDDSFAIDLLTGDTLANVVAKINTVCGGEILAADNAGFLELTSAKRGLNAEIFVVGVTDLSGGTSAGFFTELGEIQQSVANVTVQGDYPDYVDIACTASGVLTVYGSLASTGSAYFGWVVGAPASPLPEATTVQYGIIGVDTTTGPGTVELPSSFGVGDAGREITVKYEAGGNAVTVDGNGADIDGAATTPLALLYESVTVYWSGTQWFSK